MIKKEVIRKVKYLIISWCKFIPDSMMLKIQYRIFCKRKLNLKQPQRFSEKLQKYKMEYRNEDMGICVDKYRVREFVKKRGLEHILNELYQVVDDVDKIEWNSLPDSFVIKTTDGSNGDNIILVKDKKLLNKSEITKQLKMWKDKKNVCPGREWAYTQIDKSRVIIEKLLTNEKMPDAGLDDIKFFCFNGVPEYIQVNRGRYIKHSINLYDNNWNKLDVEQIGYDNFDVYEKPDNLQDLIDVASKLSEGFPFVRVDLYNINSKIVFGELTFYPTSGYMLYNPDEFDFVIGKKFVY